MSRRGDVSKGISGNWMACYFDTTEGRNVVRHFGSWRTAYDHAHTNTPIPMKVT